MSAATPDLIVLKGAPGVGKSTAAKLLAKHFPRGARVEVDTLRQMVISVDWTNQTEHRDLLKLSAQLAAGFLRLGVSPVILVDTFSGDKIDGFLDALRSHDASVRIFIVVLHATTDVLRSRMMNREMGAFRDVDIAVAINHDLVDSARSFEVLIDTSMLNPSDVIRLLLSLVRNDSARVVEQFFR